MCDDRVICKLRWNLSLKQEGDDYVIDTTQQRHSELTLSLNGPCEPLLMSPLVGSREQRRASSTVSANGLSARSCAFSRRSCAFSILHVHAGPTKTTVSKLVAPWLKLYLAQLQFEYHPKEQPYLWAVGGDFTRCQTSSQWCSTVKAAFQRWSPNKTAVPPKMLRSYTNRPQTTGGSVL